MNRLVATPRRRIAMMALLLASFLEICGCNPVRNCEELRATRLSAIPWETLLEQCAKCLSARELLLLQQSQGNNVADNFVSGMLRDATVEESLGEAFGPEFDIFPGKERDDAKVASESPGSQSHVESTTETKPIAWPIPESVVFLYASAPIDGEDARRIATGFILSLPKGSMGTAKFLVTARHVVDPEWARCGLANPQSITVRLNRRTGGVGYRTVELERNHLRQFVTSADETTDLALIPLRHDQIPDLEEFKLGDTGLDALPTESELSGLHEAQQIATVGVAIPKLFGLTDSPISQSGRIVSTAKGGAVPVRCTIESPVKSIRIWLINANVERGLSGAPVYAAFARGPHHVSTPILVGIQAIVWPDRGEAGITPGAALLEMIETQRPPTRLTTNGREAPPG